MLTMSDFWEPGEYADEQYVGEPFTRTADCVDRVERDTRGSRFPRSLRCADAYSEWRNINETPAIACPNLLHGLRDHVAELEGIHGIGSEKDCSLCGVTGSKFWMEEWGYPPIGIYFGDCPSAKSRYDLSGLPRMRT